MRQKAAGAEAIQRLCKSPWDQAFTASAKMEITGKERAGMIVKALKNQRLIADKCVEAKSFLTRFRGLIGRKAFEPGEAMFFPRCNDIHMWFMSIPIDVVFIKREKRADGSFARVVTSVREELKPWKLLPVRDSLADDTLELPAGSVRLMGIESGDELTCTS